MPIGWPDLPGLRPLRIAERGPASTLFFALDHRHGGRTVSVEVFQPAAGLSAAELQRLRLAEQPLAPGLATGELFDLGGGRWAFAAPSPDYDLQAQCRRWRLAGGAPPAEILALARPLAEALDAWFGQHGLPHGGVSPLTIGWHGDRWQLAPAPARIKPASAGQAPELATGRAHARSDQHSLAMALAEAWTGVSLTRLRGGELPGLPEHVREAFRRAADPDPARRWDSGAAFVAALAGDAPPVRRDWWTPYDLAEALERAAEALPAPPLARSAAGEHWALRWAGGTEAEGTSRRGPQGMQLVSAYGPAAVLDALAAALAARPADDAPRRRHRRLPCRLRVALAARTGPLRNVPVEGLAVDRSDTGLRVLAPVCPGVELALTCEGRTVPARVARAERRPDGMSFEIGLELPPGWRPAKAA